MEHLYSKKIAQLKEKLSDIYSLCPKEKFYTKEMNSKDLLILKDKLRVISAVPIERADDKSVASKQEFLEQMKKRNFWGEMSIILISSPVLNLEFAKQFPECVYPLFTSERLIHCNYALDMVNHDSGENTPITAIVTLTVHNARIGLFIGKKSLDLVLTLYLRDYGRLWVVRKFF